MQLPSKQLPWEKTGLEKHTDLLILSSGKVGSPRERRVKGERIGLKQSLRIKCFKAWVEVEDLPKEYVENSKLWYVEAKVKGCFSIEFFQVKHEKN